MTKCTLEGNIENHIYTQVVECKCIHTKRKQTVQLQSRQKTWTGTSLKRIYRWQISR